MQEGKFNLTSNKTNREIFRIIWQSLNEISIRTCDDTFWEVDLDRNSDKKDCIICHKKEKTPFIPVCKIQIEPPGNTPIGTVIEIFELKFSWFYRKNTISKFRKKLSINCNE